MSTPIVDVVRLLEILKEVEMYKNGDEECVMVTVTESKNDKYTPGLFQIIKLFTGKSKGGYSVTRLEDGTHKRLLSKIVSKQDLINTVLKYFGDIKPHDMCLTFGPWIIIEYVYKIK